MLSAGGGEQRVEVGNLGRSVPPCAEDRTVLVDKKSRPFRDVSELAKVVSDIEGADGFAVPVREQREVQIERLRPRDVRPRGVARDAEDVDARCGEFDAPVTQELHLVRSGRRPVEQVEEEERAAVAQQLRDRPPFPRRGPDGDLWNLPAYV